MPTASSLLLARVLPHWAPITPLPGGTHMGLERVWVWSVLRHVAAGQPRQEL